MSPEIERGQEVVPGYVRLFRSIDYDALTHQPFTNPSGITTTVGQDFNDRCLTKEGHGAAEVFEFLRMSPDDPEYAVSKAGLQAFTQYYYPGYFEDGQLNI